MFYEHLFAVSKVGNMSFTADLFENIKPSAEKREQKDDLKFSAFNREEQSSEGNMPQNDNSVNAGVAVSTVEENRTTRRPGRPRTGKMERVMCYFPKELLEDMNHFSEKEMISRNAFIITCILKHVKELKKEEKKDLL